MGAKEVKRAQRILRENNGGLSMVIEKGCSKYFDEGDNGKGGHSCPLL